VAAVEYVMVPVPEELAQKVLTYVSWRESQASTAALADDRQASVAALARAFARLDDASRALVTVIAAAVADGEEVSVAEAARRARLTSREAIGVLLEVNNVIAQEGGPPLAFGGRDLGAGAPGEFSWDTYMVVMPNAITGSIVDLARAPRSG
jgi:hypothetical protein